VQEACCNTLHIISEIVEAIVKVVVRHGLTTVKVKVVLTDLPHLRVPYNVAIEVPS
jgi:hypothetical protein